MFENYRTFSTDLAGRKLTVETGKMAQLANGSCATRIRDMFNVLPPYMDYWVSRAA